MAVGINYIGIEVNRRGRQLAYPIRNKICFVNWYDLEWALRDTRPTVHTQGGIEYKWEDAEPEANLAKSKRQKHGVLNETSGGKMHKEFPFHQVTDDDAAQ